MDQSVGVHRREVETDATLDMSQPGNGEDWPYLWQGAWITVNKRGMSGGRNVEAERPWNTTDLSPVMDALKLVDGLQLVVGLSARDAERRCLWER
jgi:hypothetical protein